jgi:hypothetical protein
MPSVPPEHVPHVAILVPLEGHVIARVVTFSEQDFERLADWLRVRPDLNELVQLAARLHGEGAERAR